MNSEQEQLDWLAFRYAAGEMTSDEAAQFEDRLAQDQTARDALTSAVDLSQTILAAESLTHASPATISTSSARPWWSSPAAWFACGAAACWLLVLAVNFTRTSPARPAVSEELVAAWSERLDLADLGADESIGEESPVAGESGDTIVATDAPDWMMEAVRALHGGSDEGRDDSSEELEGQS